MPDDLDILQARLEQHFKLLKSGKSGARPIYALEHGLDRNEIQHLESSIRKHRQPSSKHPLPWIVYATELGYQYSGSEYWQTFEEKTPGWVENGDRNWIRGQFRAFQKTYGGAVPTGAWAGQFTIICWPITHAILPRDLQQQLARILYDLRDLFSADIFESPSRLGEIVARRSWNDTSRFQNLAQDTQLVGQIAAALLLQGEFGTGDLILPKTLSRIGEDLDRERRAREWLRSARKSAVERARIRGLAPVRGSAVPFANRPEEARTQVVELGVEPRLVLRPTNLLGESWEVALEIPDLSHLLQRFPQTQAILTGSRCVVAGAMGRPLARGRLLHGLQRVILAHWPRSDEVLLQFEQSDPQLEYLLSAECLLRPETTRLFRIASDGIAYELRSKRVRPGERYVYVSLSGSVETNAHMQRIYFNCDGATGVLFSLPEALDTEWEGALRRLGLGQARTIEVWPAGLAASIWDGEGHGEWLASDRPCLAIFTDHQVDALFVALSGNKEETFEITPINPGEHVFIELPQLPVGIHKVRFSARGAPAAEMKEIGDLNVIIRIREARAWAPGVSPHGALSVQMDPSEATLEQFWEGRVDITFRGPSGRSIKCHASLFESEFGTAVVYKQLPPIPLPATPDTWRSHFRKHFRDVKNVQNAYDMARFCELKFGADELGAFTVRCEREFTPLRWAVRRHGNEYVLHLIDDTGDDEQPKVTRFTFELPSVEKPLIVERIYEVPSEGGLFVARTREFAASMIVPPSARGLADLQCNPHLDAGVRSAHSVMQHLSLVRLWGNARLPGDVFSTTRQRSVLQGFERQIFRLIGGENWAKAEENFIGRGEDWLTNMQRAVSNRREEVINGNFLPDEYTGLAMADRRKCVSFLESICTKNRLLPTTVNAAWHAELALRIASDISEVTDWAGQNLLSGVELLLQAPILARAARFLVLATDHHLESRCESGELYAGWVWR